MATNFISNFFTKVFFSGFLCLLGVLTPLFAVEDFSVGLPTEDWSYYSSSSAGRLEVVDGQMQMDSRSLFVYALNEAIYTVDLSTVLSASLRFEHTSLGDEENPLPASFTGHFEGDGVAISSDGETWYTLLNADALSSESLLTYTVDLIEAREAIRLLDPSFDYTEQTQIKFQQYDNFAAPNDGRMWDNIDVVANRFHFSFPKNVLEGEEDLTFTISVDTPLDQGFYFYLSSDSSAIQLPDSKAFCDEIERTSFEFSVLVDGVDQGMRDASIYITNGISFDTVVTLTIHEEAPNYTVEFDLGEYGEFINGELNQSVSHGGNAVIPEFRVEDGWTFTGWTHDFYEIDGPLVVRAEYVESPLAGYLHGELSMNHNYTLSRTSLTSVSSVDIDGNTAAVGVYSGIWIYTRNEGRWQRQSYVPSYGFKESFSLSGNTLVVSDHDAAEGGIYRGAVYVYERVGASWNQVAKLIPGDEADYDYFGSTVCVYDDTIAVSSNNQAAATGTHAVYLFERVNDEWREVTKLTASDGVSGDAFGASLAMTQETLVVGAVGDDDLGEAYGSAYVFSSSTGAWIEDAKLTPSGISEEHDIRSTVVFGRSVGVSGDTIVVGSHAGTAIHPYSGSVYVFQRSGEDWLQQEQLVASDAVENGGFGVSVSIHGESLLVGATYQGDAGSAYLYTHSDSGWSERRKLTDSAGENYSGFGRSVAVSGDLALVGHSIDIEIEGDSGGSGSSGNSGAGAGAEATISGGYGYRAPVREAIPTQATVARAVEVFDEIENISPAELDTIEGEAFFNCVSAYLGNPIFFLPPELGVITINYASIVDLGEPPALVHFDLGEHGLRVGGGGLLQNVIVPNGALVPEFEVEEGWYFEGWDTEFSEVTGDLKVTAEYLPLYSVNFDPGTHGSRIGGGELLQEVPEGYAAIAPEILTEEGWHFDGWSVDFSTVTESLGVVARFLETHNVAFDLGEHGSLISGNLNQIVPIGYSAIAPEVLVAPDWVFVGWDQSYTNISSSLSIQARYAPLSRVSRSSSVISPDTLPEATDQFAFGEAVAISGETVAIGSPFADEHGIVYVYTFNGSDWEFEAELKPTDLETKARFGTSVSLFGDTLAVGAPRDGSLGSISVFTRRNGVWERRATLVPQDPSRSCELGGNVVLRKGRIAAGALDFRDERENKIYIWESGLSKTWVETAEISFESLFGGEVSDAFFGHNIDLKGDTLVFSASERSDMNSIYGYRQSNGNWEVIQAGAAGPSSENLSVAFINPGVVALPSLGIYSGGYEAASLVLFGLVGNERFDRIQPINVGTRDFRRFGADMASSGQNLLVASPRESKEVGSYLHHYRYSGTEWVGIEAWPIEDGFEFDPAELYFFKTEDFQFTLDVCGDFAAVGQPNYYKNTNEEGATGRVFIYDLAVPMAAVTFSLDGKSNRVGGGELSQFVNINTAASEPVLIPLDGWMFNGWDSDFSSVTSDVTVTALFSGVATLDGDSIWDGWEQKYLGGTTVSDGTIDSDGDGDLDYEEFVSGSNPMDRDDFFDVIEERVSPEDGTVTLRFRTNDDVGSRRYRICYTDDLSTNEPWPVLPMGSFLPDVGDSTEKTFDVPGNADAYFFKVEAFIEE